MDQSKFLGQIVGLLSNLRQAVQDESALVAKMAEQLESVKWRGDTSKAMVEMLDTMVKLQTLRSQITLKAFESEAFTHVAGELEAAANEVGGHVDGDAPEPLEAQGMTGLGFPGSVNEAE